VKNAVQNRPEVAGIAASQHLMARWLELSYVEVDGATSVAWEFAWGEDFREVMGFDLVAGRDLDPDLATDVESGVLVNEMFAREHGWESPVNQRLSVGSNENKREYRVVGVVRDFYPNGVDSRMRPTFVSLAAPEQYQYALIRCRPGTTASLMAYMEEQWKTLFPHLAFDGFWLAEQNDAGDVNQSIKLVFMYIAGMVIAISSMGLLALISLNISRRTKEIGIRKALGASLSDIVTLVSHQLIAMIVIGSLVAAALGHFLVDSLLASIWPYYCDFGPWPFLLAPLLVFVVAGLTVGYRVLSAARANPVEALRYE
jgi:putative ABC transport system permease protein